MHGLCARTVAVVVAVVGASIGLAGCTPTRTTPPTPTSSSVPTPAPTVADSSWVSTKFAYVTFRHPTSWRLLQPTFHLAGPMWTVGFLTDQAANPACEPPNPSTTCDGRPFSALSSDRSVMTVGGRELVQPGTQWGATVAGLRARFTNLSAASWPGATFAQTAILTPVNDELDVTFCSALPKTTAEAVAARIFATATRTS